MSKIIIEIPDGDCSVKGSLSFKDRFGKPLLPDLEIDRFLEPGYIGRFRLYRVLKPCKRGSIVGPFVPDYEKN